MHGPQLRSPQYPCVLSSASVVACWFLQINDWLGLLLEDRSDDIYRMKGVLSIHKCRERFVFQVGQGLARPSPHGSISGALSVPCASMHLPLLPSVASTPRSLGGSCNFMLASPQR